MALLWVDGFEKYGPSGGTIQPTDILDWKYMGDYDERIDIVSGSTGNAIQLDNTSTYLATPHITNNRVLIVGFAFQFPSTITDNNWIVELRHPNFNGTTVGYSELGLRTSVGAANELKLTVCNTTVNTSTTANLQTGEWYYLELKCYCDASSGTVEVKIDGTTVLTYNGDTQASAQYIHYSNVLFHPSILEAMWVDDLYICDGTGNTNNDFLGTCNVRTLSPVSDVSNNWTLSTGNDAYALLDEDQQGSDNISSNTTGQKCTVNLGSFSGSGTIAGVMLSCDVSSNTTYPTFNKYVKFSTYNGVGTANEFGGCVPGVNGDVLCTTFIMEKNADGDDWNSTTINSLRAEVEVV
jgi:hypothetical protein